jgi:hypothetical protein
MKQVIGVTALAGCAALLMAGCGTTHATSGASGAPSAPAVTPQQRATSDAASILASFVPPPGGVRLTAAPGADGGALSTPPVRLGAPNLVDQVSWWSVPGAPPGVLSWEKAHLPGQFTMSGSGTAGSPPAMWSDDFALPAAAGVLSPRQLDLEAVSLGGGKTAVRVDAEVEWQQPKPAAEQVPATARAVTIQALPGPVVGAKVPAPVTITDAEKVRQFTSLVNGLTLLPQGRMSCPIDFGRAVQMIFRASAGGPVLATATAGLTGCQGVAMTVGGKSQPVLSGGGVTARQVLTIAGLHWTGYSGGGQANGAPVPGGVMNHG